MVRHSVAGALFPLLIKMDLSSRVVIVEGVTEDGASGIHSWMDQVGKVQEVIPKEDLFFVLFEVADAAAQALKDLNGRTYKGKVVTVRGPDEDEQKRLGEILSATGLDPLVGQMMAIFQKLSSAQRSQLKGLLGGPQPTPQVYATSVHQAPRLPVFSGETGKGDVSFERWRHEVRCLLADGTPHHLVSQAIRHSLRKTPADILTWMGEGATVNDILMKLEGLYGNALSGEELIKQFYTEAQKPEESVASWGCRLEEILTQAVNRGQVEKSAMDGMLRRKFWAELYDDRVKMATRHRLDLVNSYSQLVSEVRAVEQEFKTSKKAPSKLPRTGQVNQIQSKDPEESLHDKFGPSQGHRRNDTQQRTKPKKQDEEEETDDIVCYRCGKTGHVSYGCRAKKIRPRQSGMQVPKE